MSTGKPDSKATAADVSLPPVKPPDAGFILQLFLIPMIIVAIIVMVWLMFSWIAQMGSDPADLVRDLKSLNKDSWRKAYTLTNLLRNPEYAELKDDQMLCQELADLLDAEIEGGQTDRHRVRLRVFLCRALGEFRVENGVEALVKAATTQRDESELDVRYAAIEALAILAERTNLGPQVMRNQPGVVPALADAAALADDASGQSEYAELRSTAAFALGVIGGAEALDELATMLRDAYPNARFNAAVGLARHGDTRSLAILQEMVNPNSETVVEGEESVAAQQRKRSIVAINAIRAMGQLADAAKAGKTQLSAEQQKEMVEALGEIERSDMPTKVKIEAKNSLFKMDALGEVKTAA